MQEYFSYIPQISFDINDVEAMIKTAYIVGDNFYDSEDHHGPGENRVLALRSGLRFGSMKVKIKMLILKCFANKNNF